MPEKDAKKTTDPQPTEIDVQGGTVQPQNVSPGGGGSGGPDSLSSPLYTPTPRNDPNLSPISDEQASDIPAGAAAPQDLSDTAPQPPTPGNPAIKGQVQDSDLSGDPGNAAG